MTKADTDAKSSYEELCIQVGIEDAQEKQSFSWGA